MDSVEQRQVMEFRAKRKATLKKEFLKQYWDPHRLAKNENIVSLLLSHENETHMKQRV